MYKQHTQMPSLRAISTFFVFLFSGLIFLQLLFTKQAKADLLSCGKVNFYGNTCETLHISLDLKACGERSPKRKPEVVCRDNGNTAIASLKTKLYTYRVALKKSENWGEQNWTASEVQRFKNGSQKNENAEAAVQEKTESGEKKDEKLKKYKDQRDFGVLPKGVSVSGIIDLYYQHNFNRPYPSQPLSSASVTQASLPTGGTQLRYYDTHPNQFTINLAELSIKKSGEQISFLIDLDFGQMADLNVLNSSTTGNVYDEVSKHIGQAY